MKVVVGYTYEAADRWRRENAISPKDCILLSYADVGRWRRKLAGIHNLTKDDVIGCNLADLEYETGFFLRG